VTRIRTGRPDDLDALDQIERTAFEPARRASRRSLRRSLASLRQRVLVAETRGKVGGYAVLWCFRHTWRLYSIASDPALQGQGIGTLLLERAIGLARSEGARWLQLEARETPALQGWYARNGFEVVVRLPSYYGPGDDAVRMRLALERSSEPYGKPS
jgi:ribosomal protein S18 acetylase RimI-like enzyme